MALQRSSRSITQLLLALLAVLFLLFGCSDIPDSDVTAPLDEEVSGDGEPDEDLSDKYRDVDGDGLYHHVENCEVCHDVHAITGNLRFIREIIATPNSGDRPVIFTARQGQHSFADGDDTYDGVCEVCHTTTNHHRNDASGDHLHYVATDCVGCHQHVTEFAPSGGGSGPSHVTHAGGGGELQLACDYCHFSDLSSFRDGEPFATTTVCNECHSPDGFFDGVDDPEVGARINWAEGIYDAGVLRAGKERWCAGCHDLGTSVIDGVAAPPVAGNDSWGYFASGHGVDEAVTCISCHDVSQPHIDGVAGSYDSVLANYREAFRLALVGGEEPLVVPRYIGDSVDAYLDPPYYELCFSCHDRYALLGGPMAPAGPYFNDEMRTNFRNDASVIIPDGYDTDIAVYSVGGAELKNSHYTHLAGPPHFYDSDRDGENDSFGTCVSCHNVHGSATPAMVRDGRLVGHEPALNFGRVRYDRQHDVVEECSIMTSADDAGPGSHGGIMRANSGPTVNGVCSFCHGGGASSGDPEYLINCYGPELMAYYRVWVTPPTPSSR